MRKILLFIILYSIIFSSDFIVNVKPDTIFVGSLVNIIITVKDKSEEEVVIFYDIEEDLDNYTQLDKKLSHNSIEYVMQFWNEGHIIIPPIAIDIKNKYLDIKRLETGKININILTNIAKSDNEMRNIKPMKELELTSTLSKILMFITFITGVLISILLWNTSRTPKNLKNSQGSYNSSDIQNFINQIQELAFPINITFESTEKYYLALSNICRSFLKELLFIKATEMTSEELSEHFKLIGIETDLVKSWETVSYAADMAKYGKIIPDVDQFNVDKDNFINLIKSFHRIKSNEVITLNS